jgi:hypothetical protein
MSRGDHIKLLNEPETPPEQPQTAPFPHTDLRFGPLGGGFAVQIQLADDIAILKAFNGEAENQICDILIQRRKAFKQQQTEQLAVIKHIKERG